MWKWTLCLVAALALVRLAGAWSWRANVRRSVAALPGGARIIADGPLPPPVMRYFARSLPSGQFSRLRHTQEGEFFLKGWKPLRATQWHSLKQPGFVWDARIAMMPGLSVHVRDSYARGQGAMEARLWGIWPVMDQTGGAELAASALQRYLGEAIWFPMVLAPGGGVEWSAVDASTARATLRDGALAVALDFTFNAGGEIVRVYSPDRYREENGHFVATPWEARCRRWETRQGMRIPMEAEVGWWIAGEYRPYWRARITDLVFEP
jgi:hypothetical protein